MITTTDISNMQTVAESTMLDTCCLASKGDASGVEPTADYGSYGAGFSCGVNTDKSSEVVDGSEATLTGGVIRVPISKAPTGKQRIMVTARHGTLGTAEEYEIVGDPRRGASCFVCHVKRIVGNSPR